MPTPDDVRELRNIWAHWMNRDDEEERRFLTAVRDGDERIVGSMLRNNRRLANIENDDGQTPLFFAIALKCRDQIAEMLIERGANIDKIDDYGQTPLYIAVYKGYSKCVELLLKAGANKNFVDGEGYTLLMTATRYKGPEYDRIIKLLLNAGVDDIKKNDSFLEWFYKNSDNKFPDKFYNKIIRENLRPMNPEKMCKEDIDSISLEKIASTSSSKQNRLLVWARVPRNREATIYDCFTLHTYLELAKSGNKHPITRGRMENDKVKFYYIDPKDIESNTSSRKTGFGKGKGKKPQKRPSSAVCARAQKLGIRLTLKRNNKRVYKSEEMLRKQIKNAVTKRKQKK